MHKKHHDQHLHLQYLAVCYSVSRFSFYTVPGKESVPMKNKVKKKKIH